MFVHRQNVLLMIFTFFVQFERSILFPFMPSQSDQHRFIPPGPNDIRGPCPGLNTAANHGYLSRDGITNYQELIDMQMGLYNLDFPLSTVLAVAGILAGGDVVTGKLSIGKATKAVGGLSGTAGGLLGTPGGLNEHNRFEQDTSLTRNDYYLANGDNYKFNGTLYRMMHQVAQQHGGLYNREAMAAFRSQRYNQSLAENGQFFFSPFAILIYGAASFLYEVFPNGTDMLPTETIISSFFGADPIADGIWKSIPERLPPNWVRRPAPFNITNIGFEILKLYLKHPVQFGGNTGRPNSFVPALIQLPPDQETVSGVLCLLYQAILLSVPGQARPLTDIAFTILNFVIGKLDPIFAVQFGCPAVSFIGNNSTWT